MMRIKRFRTALEGKGLFPYLLVDLNNIRYLTGFTGSSAYLLMDHDRSYFISDARYEEYARSILPRRFEFILLEGPIRLTLKSLLKSLGRKELFIEEHAITQAQFREIRETLRGVRVIPSDGTLNEIRMVKDADEIEILRRAARLTDQCFSHLLSFVKPGMTEWDIALEIEFFYRKNGCRRSSFDPIVASGAGSSMPHYETSMKKRVNEGEVLLIDMGCHLEGYNSDLTRTVFVNSIDPALESIYTIVRNAQRNALEAIRPGITTGKLDSMARDYITGAGYGEYFGHSLGHGYGLEIHELPAVRKAGEEILRKNMTITVEPGIYIPGIGGVRIEDMVLVSARGYELLTESTRELTVI